MKLSEFGKTKKGKGGGLLAAWGGGGKSKKSAKRKSMLLRAWRGKKEKKKKRVNRQAAIDKQRRRWYGNSGALPLQERERVEREMRDLERDAEQIERGKKRASMRDTARDIWNRLQELRANLFGR